MRDSFFVLSWEAQSSISPHSLAKRIQKIVKEDTVRIAGPIE